MATPTVIAKNYPEIKWIKPVGYSLLGLTAFNMISSKVYCVSEYPIAILIGYVIGRNAANKRIIKRLKAIFMATLLNLNLKPILASI